MPSVVKQSISGYRVIEVRLGWCLPVWGPRWYSTISGTSLPDVQTTESFLIYFFHSDPKIWCPQRLLSFTFLKSLNHYLLIPHQSFHIPWPVIKMNKMTQKNLPHYHHQEQHKCPCPLDLYALALWRYKEDKENNNNNNKPFFDRQVR